VGIWFFQISQDLSDGLKGPAHAVYFATYEAVKHAMGGNEGLKHEHHPLAAGIVLIFVLLLISYIYSPSLSCERRIGDNCKRCSHESL